MRELTLKLPEPLLRALAEAAAAEDISLGQAIRAALTRDLARRQPAMAPIPADERLLAPLRGLLAQDFAEARGWADLQARLARKGYALREVRGGLGLHALEGDQRLCSVAELGHGHAHLMRRFRAPFPGHAHAWLFDRLQRSADAAALR